jgi:arsenate reductase
MSTPTFYWKPNCSTCKNARAFLAQEHVDVREIDINREPPSREFLEQHIDADRFLDFVSRHSPVFKTRPLPRSKEEAIDLMMENANLIKRPVLVNRSTVVFGFDKKRYAREIPGGKAGG